MELIPSIASTVVAIIALVISVTSNNKKDTKEDTAKSTEIVTKLNNISGYILELKADISDLRQSVQSDHDRIIKLEVSVDNAIERIENLEG